MAKSFAQKLSDARLMAAGIRAHLDELKAVSIGEDEATAIESALAVLSEIDTRQEKLKADLKSCTAELTDEVKKLDKTMQNAKKRVKLTIPQAGWQEFGISDKK